jgi:dihydrofolate reductase
VTDFVYNTATSFNGFIADANNSLDWLFAVEAAPDDDGSMAAFMAKMGAQVMGSTTYEWLLNTENLMDEPAKWQRFFGSMPTIVFSTRALPIPGGADVQVVAGPVASHLEHLRQLAGEKDVWVTGGGDLAGQFLDAGALGRIELTIAPAALAGGAPLFPRTVAPSRLRLASVTQRGQFVDLVYTVK